MFYTFVYFFITLPKGSIYSFIFFYEFNCADPGLELGDPAPLIGLLLWTCWYSIKLHAKQEVIPYWTRKFTQQKAECNAKAVFLLLWYQYDWLSNFAPYSQPISSKTQLKCVFPRNSPALDSSNTSFFSRSDWFISKIVVRCDWSIQLLRFGCYETVNYQSLCVSACMTFQFRGFNTFDTHHILGWRGQRRAGARGR